MKRGLGLALLAAALVRLPFWAEALRTPIDGDTAIVGLMARHPFASAALWGQPYGSPLDAWVAWPFLAVLGPRAEAIRVAYFALGLALVALGYLLGAALDRRAAAPAAALMACPSAYMLLLSALPPPLYPTTLVLCGLLLLLALRLGKRLHAGGTPRAGLVLMGGVAGLALWTHLMSAAVVAACAVYVFNRTRGRRRLLAYGLLPLLAVSFPWWRGFVSDPTWVARVVAVSNRDEGMADHLREVVPSLHRPVAGLLGAHTPLIADDPDHEVGVPRGAAVSLVLLFVFVLVGAATRSRFRGAPGLLLGSIALAILAFPFPLRSGAHTIRFLSAAYLPLAVLAAWVPLGRPEISGRRARGSWIVVLSLAALDLLGASRLLAAWRGADRAASPFLLADLQPVRHLLGEQHVQRAYAAYDVAYRLTFESGERLIVSEPWNERFRHYPLPYLDEVRFSKNVAWILSPERTPGDLPTSRQFEDALNGIGGRWTRTRAGVLSVYHEFVPPFGSTVESLAEAGAAGDGDLTTRLTPNPVAPLEIDFARPRELDGVTLVAAPGGPPLPRSMDVEASVDGRVFTAIARRRRREERRDLRWVNGHPQYVLDHDVIAIRLSGSIAALRVVPYASTEPWTLAEVLLHPAQAPAARIPWDEWLDPSLSWGERRRALAAKPRTDREDWYFRSLLAAAHQ